MKKLLFSLFCVSLLQAQNGISVRLVNPSIGSPNFQGFITPANGSNDSGLNTIFATHNVTYYVRTFGHPYPPFEQKMALISGTISQALVDDLVAYSAVIESAKITTDNQFTDALVLQLNSLNTGIATGTVNSIITTNDAGLNIIFQNFNVYYYNQKYPQSSNILQRYFDVVCDCDIQQLRVALLNYTSVIEAVEFSGGVILLSNNTNSKPESAVTPNPFEEKFSIESEQLIKNFTLIDLTGKTIKSTAVKSELENGATKINSGLYILKLEYDNGQTSIHKMLKK